MHLDQQLTCQTTVITQRMILEPGPHTGSDLILACTKPQLLRVFMKLESCSMASKLLHDSK